MSDKLVVAIDGPAGAGKSTIAKRLARRLGYTYIDTGAMYRAITTKALASGIDVNDNEALGELTACSVIHFSFDAEKESLCVHLDNQDVTKLIRTPEVDHNVSPVSAQPEVRRQLTILQRKMAEQGGVVMDGRDIGSVVLPNADLKIFMTATLNERANRRCLQNRQKSLPANLTIIEEELARRDKIDSTREASPLVKAHDAIEIDTTCLTIDEVLAEIEAMIQEGRA